MNKKLRRIELMVLMAVTALVVAMPLTGCKTSRLEPGGAYSPVTTNADGTLTFTQQPDVGLYAADAGFELAYAAIETAFKFERDNRVMLWKLSPQIKHGLDSIRPLAVQVKFKYAIARQAYLQSPIPANLDALNTVLAEVRSLSAAAAAALPQSKT